MGEGKWIAGLTPETPLLEAARHVLELRLQVVAEYLPRAVYEAYLDPEHVHQLRVATRRADAAVRIFRPCFPGRVYRDGRSALRKVRRAAGAARDWDVFLLALRERLVNIPAGQVAGLDCMIGYSAGERDAAQAQLAALDVTKFERQAERLRDGLQAPEQDGVLGEHAQATLTTRLARLDEAAAADLDDYDNLHKVRIAGKRLRYAMEVLADCFGPEVRERLYPRVAEMQEILGRANDSHEACERIGRLRQQLKPYPATWKRAKAGVESLLRFHQRRLPQERKRFRRWWAEWEAADAGALLA